MSICCKQTWTEISQSEVLEISRNQFWQAVWIWNVKPNVVNRRLFASQILHCFEFVSGHPTEEDFLDLDISCNASEDELEKTIIHHLKEKLDITECSEQDVQQFTSKSYLLIKKIFFKNQIYKDTLEICCISYSKNFISHYPLSRTTDIEKISSSIFPLMLIFDAKKIRLKIFEDLKNSINYDWLIYLLLPKLQNWSKKAGSEDNFIMENNSLKLVPVNIYNELYLLWKEKYGKQLVEKWTENTDPLKFVFEDIAIAVYLSILWKNEKVNFVDMGCGNGLLVHILSQEGHRGLGIDIRPRKIWSLYQPAAMLEVNTISPFSNWNYPHADWIIGNHSDELTPWIPVFAARNSFKCKFFLLPCCAYEFSGKRYQRQNSNLSSYNDYIEYVKSISSKIGFQVKIDKLRIPSTKRICLIGDERMYSLNSYSDILKEQIEPIFMRYSSLDGVDKFVPRKSIEAVRNCTQIDRTISSKIDSKISQALIEKQLKMISIKKNDTDAWSDDYSISFKEAISLLNVQDLKELKNECGGLKTLLRNNHSVYLIRNGKILFRKPTERHVSTKWKNRLCWFFHNHPLSCPLSENKCSFVH